MFIADGKSKVVLIFMVPLLNIMAPAAMVLENPYCLYRCEKGLTQKYWVQHVTTFNRKVNTLNSLNYEQIGSKV